MDRSYLFNLSSDHVIDAKYKGGKARFINHSEEANCEARTLFLNGDQRIGFFACKDVKAESELFFDYSYNVAINNHLIDKAGKLLPWMKPKKESKKPAAKSKKKSHKKRRRTDV
jgi:SET domain-containing protein